MPGSSHESNPGTARGSLVLLQLLGIEDIGRQRQSDSVQGKRCNTKGAPASLLPSSACRSRGIDMKPAPATQCSPGWGCQRRLLPSRQRSSAALPPLLSPVLCHIHRLPSARLAAVQGGMLAGESVRKSSDIPSPCGEVQHLPLGLQHPSPAGLRAEHSERQPSVPARQLRSPANASLQHRD